MKGELFYLNHPHRMRVIWAIVYMAIVVLFIFGMFEAAARIRTHTLPVGQVQLKIPYSKYLVGEAISFTITNDYNSSIYVTNNCPAEPLAVYRLENGSWIRQHDQASLSDCPNQQRQISVPAKGEVSGSFAPWHNLFARTGKYRVVAYVEHYHALPYQEFEIIAKPANAATPSTPVAATTKATTQTATLVQQPVTSQTTARQSKTVSTARGSITVEYDTTSIYVTTVAPASGCSYEGGRSGRQVEVTFKCSGGETQVQLSLVNGKLASKIESGDD